MDIDTVYTKIRLHLDLKLPFVAYQKAEENTLQAFFQQDDNLYEINNYSSKGFVFAPFDDKRKAILIPENKSTYCSVTNTNKKENTLVNKFSGNKRNEVIREEDKRKHLDLIIKGIQSISFGDFKKVVLSRKEEVKTSELDVLQLFIKLIHSYPEAFVYCWYHPKVGLWLGATPETLLNLIDNQLDTMALAGTQSFRENEVTRWGAKEKEEQQLVADFIIDSLTNVATDISKSNTYTHKAGTLLHLRTDIRAVLKKETKDITDIIRILHPTPAVCGLPKNSAKSFILNDEGYERKFYTGFLGELNISKEGKTESNLYVNLRCMELDAKKMNIYIGGGITKDSDPEKEWNETVRKTETMKKVLF